MSDSVLSHQYLLQKFILLKGEKARTNLTYGIPKNTSEMISWEWMMLKRLGSSATSFRRFGRKDMIDSNNYSTVRSSWLHEVSNEEDANHSFLGLDPMMAKKKIRLVLSKMKRAGTQRAKSDRFADSGDDGVVQFGGDHITEEETRIY
ncbi:hypothetical protein Tco_0797149 [Tanacetum coccineum]